MSEQAKLPSIPGWLIHDYAIQHLEGKLLTLIESWGLKDSQEKAVKDLVRQEVWSVIHGAEYVSDKQADKIREENIGFGQVK